MKGLFMQEISDIAFAGTTSTHALQRSLIRAERLFREFHCIWLAIVYRHLPWQASRASSCLRDPRVYDPWKPHLPPSTCRRRVHTPELARRPRGADVRGSISRTSSRAPGANAPERERRQLWPSGRGERSGSAGWRAHEWQSGLCVYRRTGACAPRLGSGRAGFTDLRVMRRPRRVARRGGPGGRRAAVRPLLELVRGARQAARVHLQLGGPHAGGHGDEEDEVEDGDGRRRPHPLSLAPWPRSHPIDPPRGSPSAALASWGSGRPWRRERPTPRSSVPGALGDDGDAADEPLGQPWLRGGEKERERESGRREAARGGDRESVRRRATPTLPPRFRGGAETGEGERWR